MQPSTFVSCAGLEAKIAVMKSQTFIEAALKDIDVYDPSADAIFPEVLVLLISLL